MNAAPAAVDPEAAAFLADTRAALAPKPAPEPQPAAQPTTELRFAVQRFLALAEAHHHQPVGPRGGRWLIRQAVYGDLWHPGRVGEVPVRLRPVLRALVKQINDAVFPGGALARSVSVEQARDATRALTP